MMHFKYRRDTVRDLDRFLVCSFYLKWNDLALVEKLTGSEMSRAR